MTAECGAQLAVSRDRRRKSSRHFNMEMFHGAAHDTANTPHTVLLIQPFLAGKVAKISSIKTWLNPDSEVIGVTLIQILPP